jgi:L-ascorbate metabolism protein UlaG (beta-lactamase superfamily)
MKFLVFLGACFSLTIAAHGQAMRQTQTFETSAGPVKITPIYHATALIEAGGKVIYVDPAGKLKFPNLPPGPVDFTGFRPADLILITDIHGDHMDANAVTTLSKTDTQIIAPPSVAKMITAAKVVSNGESTTWDKWTIDAIPMYNMVRGPAPGKFFHDKGRGNGYVLTYGGKRFYFSGDTEGIPEMRALKNIDVAFICMFERPTMPPEEAADAVLAFHPKVAIPYHYGTSDPTIFQMKLAGSGIEVRLLDWYPKAAD